MPPLPTIADVYRCTFVHFGASLDSVNVLHFRAASATVADVAAGIQEGLDAANPFDGIPLSFTTPAVEILPLDGSSATATFPITGANGTGGGDFIPAACFVVSLRTAQRGPRGRGRVYVGPLVESLNHDGKLLTADATGLADNWRDFIDGCAGATPSVQLVVASYVHADAHDVVSHRVDIPLGTQRRRQQSLFS